jgi:LacI family transcriptional regulator
MKLTRKARIVDVARDAGVSAATVSRALSQPQLLTADTLARVRQSALRLGYRPDAAARALASGRSMTIGAVVPTLDNAIFSRALQSMQQTLAARGYQLLVSSHDYNAAAEAEAVKMLVARGVDGLMLVGAERAPETEGLLADAGVPVVLTWRGVVGRPAVVVDNHRAGELAARHLVELGHRRIGIITGSHAFNDRQRAREEGARICLAAAGLPVPDWLAIQVPTTLAGGRSGCASLLGLAEPPTAVIGGIDLIAIGCMVEAQARGLAVPDDLSVVGIDDLDMSAHLSPPLSTIHIPTGRIGAKCAEMLCDLIEARPVDPVVDLHVELVVRRSTGGHARTD